MDEKPILAIEPGQILNDPTKWDEIYNFVARHKASFFIAGAWIVREWHTVKGWHGLVAYWLTGSVQ